MEEQNSNKPLQPASGFIELPPDWRTGNRDNLFQLCKDRNIRIGKGEERRVENLKKRMQQYQNSMGHECIYSQKPGGGRKTIRPPTHSCWHHPGVVIPKIAKESKTDDISPQSTFFKRIEFRRMGEDGEMHLATLMSGDRLSFNKLNQGMSIPVFLGALQTNVPQNGGIGPKLLYSNMRYWSKRDGEDVPHALSFSPIQLKPLQEEKEQLESDSASGSEIRFPSDSASIEFADWMLPKWISNEKNVFKAIGKSYIHEKETIQHQQQMEKGHIRKRKPVKRFEVKHDPSKKRCNTKKMSKTIQKALHLAEQSEKKLKQWERRKNSELKQIKEDKNQLSLQLQEEQAKAKQVIELQERNHALEMEHAKMEARLEGVDWCLGRVQPGAFSFQPNNHLGK